MFSNRLIRELASDSDETRLRLSPADWRRVVDANREFSEAPDTWRGDPGWAGFLLSKVSLSASELSLRDSLELCCGNGFLFFSFREVGAVHKSASFVDLSELQLNAFRQRCLAATVDVPHLFCADIGRLPFPDASLDLVYGNSFLHHLPDVQHYLREVCRVLRPGGRFVAFHEPNRTAPFLENFPRSLFRDIDVGCLTDIWLIRPEIIVDLARGAGFAETRVDAGGLLYAFLVNPFYIVAAKMRRGTDSRTWVRLRHLLAQVERLIIPKLFRLRFAPSVAFVAVK